MPSFAFDPFAGSSAGVVASDADSVADSAASVASDADSVADSAGTVASGAASDAASNTAAMIITESAASQYKVSHMYLDLDYSMVVVYP